MILIQKKGQKEYGFVELFVTDGEPMGKRTAAIVNYMAAGLNEHPHPRIAVTLLTELQPSQITDGLFHEFFNDLIDQQIKLNAQQYYANATKVSYLDTVTMHVDSIDSLSILSNGDVGIL